MNETRERITNIEQTCVCVYVCVCAEEGGTFYSFLLSGLTLPQRQGSRTEIRDDDDDAWIYMFGRGCTCARVCVGVLQEFRRGRRV